MFCLRNGVRTKREEEEETEGGEDFGSFCVGQAGLSLASVGQKTRQRKMGVKKSASHMSHNNKVIILGEWVNGRSKLTIGLLFVHHKSTSLLPSVFTHTVTLVSPIELNLITSSCVCYIVYLPQVEIRDVKVANHNFPLKSYTFTTMQQIIHPPSFDLC